MNVSKAWTIKKKQDIIRHCSIKLHCIYTADVHLQNFVLYLNSKHLGRRRHIFKSSNFVLSAESMGSFISRVLQTTPISIANEVTILQPCRRRSGPEQDVGYWSPGLRPPGKIIFGKEAGSSRKELRRIVYWRIQTIKTRMVKQILTMKQNHMKKNLN